MYLEKLNELLGSLPLIKIRQVDSETWRAETSVDNYRFVGFDPDCSVAIELCAKLAVFYIDPNNWVDDIID